MGKNHVRGPTGKGMMLATERELQAFELRKAGVSFPQIGRQLGIAPSTAHNCVMRHLRRMREETTETAKDVLVIELARLDRLWLTVYQKAIEGDLEAVRVCLKISARRAAFLGLDAPERVAHLVSTMDENTVQENMDAMRRLAADPEASSAISTLHRKMQEPGPITIDVTDGSIN